MVSSDHVRTRGCIAKTFTPYSHAKASVFLVLIITVEVKTNLFQGVIPGRTVNDRLEPSGVYYHPVLSNQV